MRSSLAVVLVALAMAPAAMAAEQTWTGVISESHCTMKHATEYRGRPITARECIVGREGPDGLPGCIKNGAQFVFVSDGKVHKVANQDFKDLWVHAAETVRLTGELKGDAITVKRLATSQTK